MQIPDRLKTFITVIEQRAAQHGEMFNVTYQEESDYVVDFYIHVGYQVFQLWWNRKAVNKDDMFGWRRIQ